MDFREQFVMMRDEWNWFHDCAFRWAMLLMMVLFIGLILYESQYKTNLRMMSALSPSQSSVLYL